MQIREPAVANQFYPGDAHRLKQDILRYVSSSEFSEKAQKELGGKDVRGIVVPHAGYIYSGGVAAYGYRLLKRLPKDIEWKILLLGPSHHIPFNGAAPFPDGVWKTPLGDVRVKDVREEVGGGEGDGAGDDVLFAVPEAHTDEHSLEVQVPFLQVVLDKFILYPVVCGGVRPDFLASALAEFAARDDVITVVSSDLSHFLSYEEAEKIDGETLDAIARMDIEKVIERGDACGVKGILTMMFLAEKLGWKPTLLNYKNSGDTAGDKSSVVGYGSVAFVK